MKLLICTQTVNSEDSDLGFFHRWIEEFAQQCEQVTVVCLRKGVVTLPTNVEVITLGDQHRVVRAFELCAIAFGRRAEYDAVFVHMNPEYLVAAGWLWRLMAKKTVLWYVHKSVDLKLRIAEKFANIVVTASKESFRLPSRKVHIMGHGIDTDFFAPDASIPRGKHILSAGRLAPSKRHDLVVRAAALAGRKLRIAGEGGEKSHLATLAKKLGVHVVFLGGLAQEKMRDEFRRAAVFVHTSETGSMDKVVLEALATECPVLTTSTVYSGLPVENAVATPEALSRAILRPQKSRDLSNTVRAKHSLQHLIPRILDELR